MCIFCVFQSTDPVLVKRVGMFKDMHIRSLKQKLILKQRTEEAVKRLEVRECMSPRFPLLKKPNYKYERNKDKKHYWPCLILPVHTYMCSTLYSVFILVQIYPLYILSLHSPWSNYIVKVTLHFPLASHLTYS